MRASIAGEAAGVPTVSIVCQGFEGQAAATGRGHGYDGLALASTRGHVDAQGADEVVSNFVEYTIPQIIDGLTRVVDAAAGPTAEPTATDVAASGTIDQINATFVANGWSDGLPIIPPTRERVEAWLLPSGNDPWRILGTAASSGRDITIWSIAVNAVMTGCAPEHLPVLIAAAQALADPAYGAEHSGNTTGADALMVVSGPTSAAIGLNAGQGALREGAHANTSIGRWLRLYLRNVFEFTADAHDKATFGNSTRVVLTEDSDALEEIGWLPLAADLGCAPDQDVLSIVRLNSGLIVGSVFGSTPTEILPYLADSLVRVSGWDLTHVYGLSRGRYMPLLVLSPVLARVFASAGWTKPDVQQALFDLARMPAWRFEKLIGEWTNLTAGRRSMGDLVEAGHIPPAFAESSDPERLVPIVTDPSCFMIAVAGDPNRTNAYVFSNDGAHGDWIAKPIDFETSTDLFCEVPTEPTATSSDTMSR